ncbi:tetratricopeptide repeat protein [Undibacterium sp.]|uniref:tetratricopeptide repeat protein n=1 Tax=Undibacterium sp. TaxID=1914977 RepID=UPI00272F935B|nr:hypothetical protein [Undibacterium sp.]MDP1978684.1 hypothetical protein [Undibacterium sp.]
MHASKVLSLIICAILSSCTPNLPDQDEMLTLSRKDLCWTIDQLEDALQENPDSTPIQLDLSAMYQRLGNLDRAWYHAHHAAYKKPHNPDVAHALGKLYELMLSKYMNCEGHLTLAIVHTHFGEPDRNTTLDGNLQRLQYGPINLDFDNEKLVNAQIIPSAHELYHVYLAMPKLGDFRTDQNQYSLQLIESPDDEERKMGVMPFYSADAPRDKRFHIVNCVAGMPYSLLTGVQFDENGLAYLKDTDAPLRMCFNISPGEVVHYWLISDQGQPLSRGKMTRYPIVVQNNGYHLTWELVDLKNSLFLVHVEGLDPLELVEFKSVSCGEEIAHEHQADESGDLTFIFSPAVIGKMGGWNTIEIKGKNGPISLRYPWGNLFHSWAQETVRKADEARKL